MADITNLSNFLGDIASAIREKKGTTEPIPAQEFDSEIASIETGDIKLFNTEEELAADSPDANQLALVCSDEIKSIPLAAQIASFTEYKTLYFPKVINCEIPVTSTINFTTNYSSGSSGGNSGAQSLTPTEFNVYFHSQSQYAEVSYTSVDGVVYTRTNFSCEEESWGWRDDPIFILDEANDCLILDPTNTITYVWYGMTSEDTDGSLAAILQQFFSTKRYALNSLHVAIPQEDTTLARTASHIAIGDSYSVPMTHVLSQRSIDPFITATNLVKTYCTNNGIVIASSTTNFYGGLTKIISDTKLEMYLASYKNTSGTSYQTRVYFFTPKEYTTVTPEDEIYICAGFHASASYTPYLYAFTIDLETSTVTQKEIELKTYTDASSSPYVTKYIPTDIDREGEYTYVYSASSVYGLGIYTLNSSGIRTNYSNMTISLGYGTSPQYIYAPNQFTVHDASHLLPGYTALGTTIPITGDESVYTEMSNDEYISAGTAGTSSDLIERKVFSATMIPNKLTRCLSSAYTEPFNIVMTTSDEYDSYSYTYGDTIWNSSGSGNQLQTYMNNQIYFSVASDSSDTSYSKIVCYSLTENKPYCALALNSGKTYSGGGAFVHNDTLYGVLYKSTSYGQPLYITKLTSGATPTVLYTIPAISNYYIYPKIYWNGYLYYYYVGRSTSYTSGYLRRINIDTGTIQTLLTVKDVNGINAILYDGGLEICIDPYSVVSSTMQWVRIESDNTYTTKTYTMPDTSYGAITAIFNYNGEKYMQCVNKKQIYKVDDTSNTMTIAHTYTTTNGYVWHQPDKNGPLYSQYNTKAISAEEMFTDASPAQTSSSYILSNSESIMYHDSYTGNNLDYALYPARLLHRVDNTDAADTVLYLPDTYSYSMFGNTCDYHVMVLAEPTDTIYPNEYNEAIETVNQILGEEV